jgi:membrane protein insertase Oxa1/YidC/SpoIIIJ
MNYNFEKMLYIIITNVFTTLQNITVIGRKVTESQCETERET